MKNFLINLFFLIILSESITFAQSEQKLADIGDLQLTSGQFITNCKIGYRTFGQINQDSNNVIIFPTWFEGTSESVGRLIQKYSFLDTTKYFIIAIDALGDGISSSPSNYNVYKIKSYPDITIRDMVNSQYKLVKNVFGIDHLFGAVGGSLGGMQVLEWAVAYPNFIDKIISYVGTPKLTTYDLLWMNTQLNIIETGMRYGVSEQEIRKSLAMMMAGLSRTPDYVVDKVKPEDFQTYLSGFDKEYSQTFTLEDYLFQLRAIMTQNISKNFNNSIEAAASIIKTKMMIIISETDLLVNPTETKVLAKLTNAKTLYLNNNCGHLAVSCELERCSKEIADFLGN